MRCAVLLLLCATASACADSSRDRGAASSAPVQMQADDAASVVAVPVETAPGPEAIVVRVVGKGRPMLLVPGLACSHEVWRGAERRFGDSWQLHLVTIAGFAGTEPIEPPLLDAVRRALLRYIDDQHLESPVIMGHSLGAMVALWVAGTATSPIGAVIALDGVAYGAALRDPAATPDTMRPRAEAVRARVAALDADAKAAQARAMFAPMVTDPDDLEWIMRGVLASDAASVGQGMYELMTTDVRPFAAAIKAPVLMMVAGEHFAGDPHPDLAAWEDQLDGVDQRRVVLVPGARHFVMVDAEQFVYDEVARFVATE